MIDAENELSRLLAAEIDKEIAKGLKVFVYALGNLEFVKKYHAQTVSTLIGISVEELLDVGYLDFQENEKLRELLLRKDLKQYLRNEKLRRLI